MIGWVCLAWAAWSATAQAAAPPAEAARFRGALEVGALLFPTGVSGPEFDLLVPLTPVLAFDGGEGFAIEVGADLRLRAREGPLRREDWDELADFGQLLRHLRVGNEGSSWSLRAGPTYRFTLGLGHLLSRYTNRDNANYHPASAEWNGALGATRLSLFASDVLSGRIFAGEFALDVAQLFGAPQPWHDRYRVSFSAAHDAGLGRLRAPPVSVLHLDASATIWRSETSQGLAFVGVGSRVGVPTVDVGAVLGLSAEGWPNPWVQLGGKLELRKQHGGFRQGLFGPAYELSRFASRGFREEPISEERLPDGFSGYGEVRLQSGNERSATQLRASGSVEYFSWRRADADVALALSAWSGRGLLTARWVGVAMGVAVRHLVTLELRYRFVPAVYALASAGTAFFPQTDRSLIRGTFAGLGVGVDFER